MKKLFSLLVAAFIFNVSIAIVPFTDGAKPVKATELMIPIGKSGQMISLADFSKLKPAEYEKLAKVKLGFFDRMAYKMAMRKLRKGIAADGTITNKKIANLIKPADSSEGFHLGGFALGFLLGLIGILIAYVAFSDENKSNRVKWAWLGLLAGVVLGIILIVTVLKSAK